jgi:hypothetical protein
MSMTVGSHQTARELAATWRATLTSKGAFSELHIATLGTYGRWDAEQGRMSRGNVTHASSNGLSRFKRREWVVEKPHDGGEIPSRKRGRES